MSKEKMRSEEIRCREILREWEDALKKAKASLSILDGIISISGDVKEVKEMSTLREQAIEGIALLKPTVELLRQQFKDFDNERINTIHHN